MGQRKEELAGGGGESVEGGGVWKEGEMKKVFVELLFLFKLWST